MRDVLLTIDTEGPRGTDPIRYQIWGDVNGVHYGIPKIIEVCDKYGIKGLFFVDIPEIWDYGFDKIADVIRYIKDKGHDVGIHIHPHHLLNEDRQFLYEYSKEEQREIICECTKVYRSICGENPKSFRAGKYGANMDTLTIIQELGYQYDFSEFYSNRWCGIKPEIAYVLPQRIGKIIEFPVTVFKSIKIPKLYSRFDKLEITSSFSEIRHILTQYSKDDHKGVIILFLHSFSFLNYLETPDKPTLNKQKLRTFEHVIEYVSSSKDFRCICENDLCTFDQIEDDKEDNIVATKGILRQLWYSYLRIFRIRRSNKKAKIIIYGTWILIFLVIVFLCLLIWRN